MWSAQQLLQQVGREGGETESRGEREAGEEERGADK